MPENLLVVDDADMVVAEGASEDDAMDVDVSVESAASVQVGGRKHACRSQRFLVGWRTKRKSV